MLLNYYFPGPQTGYGPSTTMTTIGSIEMIQTDFNNENLIGKGNLIVHRKKNDNNEVASWAIMEEVKVVRGENYQFYYNTDGREVEYEHYDLRRGTIRQRNQKNIPFQILKPQHTTPLSIPEAKLSELMFNNPSVPILNSSICTKT